MKVIIIGGVAAGTKTAAKLKREAPDAEVIVYTKSEDISYAGCGLPYYVGGAIETEEVLDAIERAILIFRNEGITSERFADTVNRLGFEYVEDKILNAPINKEEILNKKVKGGASC